MEDSHSKAYEKYAYILAVIPPKITFRSTRPRGETVIQAIGEEYFTLLELIPRKGVKLHPQERVHIAKNARGKIDRVKRRIFYDDLTPESEEVLPLVIDIIVTKYEMKYVEFFNTSQPITTRMHSLQLLPGIGQTLMWAILEERKKEPFRSFDDISARTKLQHPKKAIKERILAELREEVKRWLFVKPPHREEKHEGRERRRRER